MAHISFGIYLKPSQWDTAACRVVGNAPNGAFVNEHVSRVMLDVQRALLELQDAGGVKHLCSVIS